MYGRIRNGSLGAMYDFEARTADGSGVTWRLEADTLLAAELEAHRLLRARGGGSVWHVPSGGVGAPHSPEAAALDAARYGAAQAAAAANAPVIAEPTPGMTELEAAQAAATQAAAFAPVVLRAPDQVMDVTDRGTVAPPARAGFGKVGAVLVASALAFALLKRGR